MIRALLISAVLVLAACDQHKATPAQVAAGPTVAKSANAEPGPKLVPVAVATQIYGDLCIATAPTFQALPTRVTAPFVENTQYGTYYSQELNLSVKLVTLSGRRYCSMVFKSSASEAEVKKAFAALSPSVTILTNGFDGYYNAKLRGQS